MGRAGRTSEPCKHSIIIVVRENTDLSSISRLVGSAPLVLRVALKIMTACASILRLLASPSLSPPSSLPLLVVPFHRRTLLRFFFVTSLTDRPWWAEFPETKEREGGWKGTFLLLNCLYATSFQAICSRRILLKAEVESSVSSGYFCSNGWQQWRTPIWRMEKEFIVESKIVFY